VPEPVEVVVVGEAVAAPIVAAAAAEEVFLA